MKVNKCLVTFTDNFAYSLRLRIAVVLSFRETTLIKYILRSINTYDYIISITGKIFKSSFLLNLFGDTNIAGIFYKKSGFNANLL